MQVRIVLHVEVNMIHGLPSLFHYEKCLLYVFGLPCDSLQCIYVQTYKIFTEYISFVSFTLALSTYKLLFCYAYVLVLLVYKKNLSCVRSTNV